MDAIFKALNDPTRRHVLDLLRETDGQTLSELEAQVEMSRFGLMKHLGVLEEAGLITAVKRGRFKHHYLNAVPLQEVMDRWIEPLVAGPMVRGMIALKQRLEQPMKDVTPRPDYVHQVFIRCTAEDLWTALTDPAQIARYHFLTKTIAVDGDALRYLDEDGETMLTCRTVIEEPPHRLETTFEPHPREGSAPSRTVFTINEAPAGHCALTVEHYDLTHPVVPGRGIADGWPRWASGLKTFLETGEVVRFTSAAD